MLPNSQRSLLLVRCYNVAVNKSEFIDVSVEAQMLQLSRV